MKAPALGEILQAFYGSWRLARFDPQGLSYLGKTGDDFRKSFFAAVIVLPVWLVLLHLHVRELEITAGWPTILAIQLPAYIISWTLYPVIMDGLCRQMDRDAHYFHYITAFNWIRVLQTLVFAAATLVGLLLPGNLSVGLTFIVLLAVLVYHGFVARQALQVGRGTAAALVFLDFFLGLVITVWADSALLN
ncbi:hypothetical protein [Fodinicurvata fenggangensis]|uniref:hypothetical protein n=1 Tax=Fodinicurvata fenggangensis TaxID=1121830 RepID=UPI00047974C4|nr:hypothetical protein [Fodinicurvata fenggangensis]